MAPKTPLQKARKLLQARKFPKVISLLEPLVPEYRESYLFFYILGTACLYVEDIGGAETYYRCARKLKPSSVPIRKAQAALYLRLGEVARAVEFYLDVLEASPADRQAKAALQFIRKNASAGNFEEKIHRGAVRKFYPSLGMNPAVPPVTAAVLLLCAAGVFVGLNYKVIFGLNGARADLSYLELTREEKLHLVSGDLTAGVFRYIMTTSEVNDCYNDAKRFFQQSRDNEVRRCINRLMNSNASVEVKERAGLLAEKLEEPRYGELRDNYDVRKVMEEPCLYGGCWVQWSGRVTNVVSDEKFYKCSFLVGYENLDRIDETVELILEQPVSIDGAKPLTVLGRIVESEGFISIWGKAVYQPFE